MTEITVEQLLAAYANGYFPMAESRDSKEVFWYYPEERGIIPLEDFHVPKSLAKLVRKNPFTITFDKAFPEVLKACADARDTTWINDTIIALYTRLYERGHAHSVECWEGEELVGGLYGVSLGRAFFGESMFSTKSGASKIALVYLVERLRESGFTLLDAQYVNEHLKQFGIIEIPRDEYLEKLKAALE